MRIILADHHPQSLWALKISLQAKPEFNVIGEAEDAEGLCKLVAVDPPDLVLMDGELPGKAISELIAELHDFPSRPVVVAMGMHPEFGRILLNAGADAFVSKSEQPAWLLEVLQKFERRTRKKKNNN